MRIQCRPTADTELLALATQYITQYGAEGIDIPHWESYKIETEQCLLTKLHSGGRADIYSITINSNVLCAKYFHDQRLGSKIKNRLGIGRAQKAYNNGLLLEQANIPYSKVIGVGMLNTFSPPILFMEMLEQYEQVNLFIEQWKQESGSIATDPRLALLSNCLAKFTASLIKNHILHQDYSPRNILLNWQDSVPSLRLIDLEDITQSNRSENCINHFTARMKRYLNDEEYHVFIEHFNPHVLASH
jgi:hypothetical protein